MKKIEQNFVQAEELTTAIQKFKSNNHTLQFLCHFQPSLDTLVGRLCECKERGQHLIPSRKIETKSTLPSFLLRQIKLPAQSESESQSPSFIPHGLYFEQQLLS